MADDRRRKLLLAFLNAKRVRYEGDDVRPSGNVPARVTNYVEETVPRYSPTEFSSHFRMHPVIFEKLVKLYGRALQSQNQEKLWCLWFLATPDSYRSIADRFGMSKGTTHYVCSEFIRAFSTLKMEHIKWPTTDEATQTVEVFASKYGFPGVVGATDGCHIQIKEPVDMKDNYYNRKGQTSILLQGTCDHRKKFIDICCGWPGLVHDARVWRNSSLSKALADGRITLAPDRHLIADSAYPLETFLLTPFRNNGHLSEKQLKYNKCLSGVRSIIERSFADLKNKFRRLKFLDMTRTDRITDHIVTCCILHNIILEDSGECADDEEDMESIEENPTTTGSNSSQGSSAGARKRNSICDML